jgi:cobalt-zinc-cadmium efflux system protein
MHDPKPVQDRIGVAFFLNVTFTIIEFIGGWLTNSTAIMADAVHDLGDSLAIGLAWLLNRYSDKGSTQTLSYGYRRLSLFGATLNSFILIAGAIWILSEAIPKLFAPEMPMAEGMLGLALLGIAVNGYAAFKLSSGKTLNEKVLSWHLIEDTLGWVAVLVVSIVLMFVDWPILDPLLSIAFTLFILVNVFRNLSAALKLFLQAVPDKQVETKIRERLAGLNQVASVHDLHFWSLDGEHHVLTVHLVLNRALLEDEHIALKQRIASELQDFHLEHTTIEFELPDEICRDEPGDKTH